MIKVLHTPFDDAHLKKLHAPFHEGVIIIGDDPMEIETEIQRLLTGVHPDSFFTEAINDVNAPPYSWRAVGKIRKLS